jgi:hypothetical protein
VKSAMVLPYLIFGCASDRREAGKSQSLLSAVAVICVVSYTKSH